MKAYMTSLMVSCVVICWPPNIQCVKCMPYPFNLCPHSHVRRLDAKGWIKSTWKRIVEVKVNCAMQNERIDGLVTNHILTPLPEQELMWVLDDEEMESFSKISLKDVSWWMSIRDAYNLGASVIAKLSKERCIFLTTKGKLFHIAWGMTEGGVGPLQPKRHTPPKQVYWR